MLDQDVIPIAVRIHCFLVSNAPNSEKVYFQIEDHLDVVDDDDACWETTLMPPDDLGPAHVIYRDDYVEVLRFWSSMWGGIDEIDDDNLPITIAQTVAKIRYDDRDLLGKVLMAATRELLEDWGDDIC